MFDEGAKLLDENKPSEACPKLEASRKLDPQIGTTGALAECYEQMGKVASAWSLYREVSERAAKAGERERAEEAAERARGLAPRIPRVTIVVPAASLLPGLAVTLDGVVLDHGLFGVAMPLDPGPHRIAATAPEHVAWQVELTVAEGESPEEEVPLLVRAERSAVASEASGQRGDAAPARGRRKLYGGLLSGAGVLGLAGGAFFGIQALSHKDDAIAAGCTVGGDCRSTESGAASWQDGESAANLSTAFFVAGTVVLGVGAYLFFSAPSAGNTTAVSLVPSSSAGLELVWSGVY
jgi:serine/threonine-protein kinase